MVLKDDSDINNSNGNDNDATNSTDLTQSNSTRSTLDKRQEMLKKAMERRKRTGVKIKEVVVEKSSSSASADGGRTRLSKEELARKKSELDKKLKMVDAFRESQDKIEDRVQPVDKVAVEQIIVKATVVDTVVQASAPAEVVAPIIAPLPTVDVAPTITPANIVVDAPVEKTEDLTAEVKAVPLVKTDPSAEKSDKWFAKPDDQQRKPRQQSNGERSADSVRREHSENRQYNSNRNDGRAFARPFTPKKPGESLGYTPKGETPPGGTDRPQRTYGSSGGYSGGGGNYSGGGPNRDRGDKPDYRQGGSGAGTGGRAQGGGAGRPPQRNQSSTTSEGGGLSLLDDDRRRAVKKKVDDVAKDLEAKKVKQKKDSKNEKSWAKTIHEGIDELNIEKEVQIAPTIDISDLAEFDTDKKKQNTYRPRYDKRFRRRGDKSQGQAFTRPTNVSIGDRVNISDFSALIGVKAADLIKKLFAMGVLATVNQTIDSETAKLLAMDYEVDVDIKTVTEEDLMPSFVSEDGEKVKRSPIVTVMGHVDHGKTSLLDTIRSTSVVAGEAGGITQHIGAYEVETASGKITFLDTPGHEAFTTLRARGALLTDIVILVVAADDGVKPQTKEAIDHAKAAGVRIVVAINKIDKEGANPQKVRQQLADYGIISDEWGGENQFQEISAKKHIGIDDLLERVLLEAEVLDLRGDPNRPAEGVVIESRLDKQKGPVATILIKEGTLRKGDTFISGNQFGKIRAMFNFKGVPLKEASVSVPCEIMGFTEVPQAGEKLMVVDEKVAKQVAELRANIAKEKQQQSRTKLSLADFFDKTKGNELKEMNIVVKGDAQGSIEALTTSLIKLSNTEVRVNIIHSGIGAITESDVTLAAASNAIIIGFNVRPDNNAKAVADKEDIDIELYSIIYKAIDDVKLALEGMLNPDMRDSIIGKVEIRQIFSVPKLGKIAGSFVVEGKITRNSSVRIIRDSIVVFDGKVGTLKRFADDAKEVVAGYECGLSIDKFQDIKEGDILEVYEVVQEKRTLADVEKAEKAEKAEEKRKDELKKEELRKEELKKEEQKKEDLKKEQL